MTDILLTIIVSAVVTSVVLLAPYAWMLLPQYREPRWTAEDYRRFWERWEKDYRAGLEQGLRTASAAPSPPRTRP